MSSTARPVSRFSRRSILRGLTGAVAGLSIAQLLQACSQPAAPSPTAVPAQPVARTSSTPAPAVTPASAAPAQATPTTAPARAATGPTHVTSGAFADAQILNPILSKDTASGEIIDLLFSSLVVPVPPNGKISGMLASEWKVSEDGLTYTFSLRKGVKFHDGQELTADDVKFTFDSIFDPEIDSPRRSTASLALAGPDSVVVKDPYTVEFKLKQPYAPFLVNIANRGILPKHILGSLKGKDFNSADFNTKSPVGSGPYKFKEWVKDDHITLEANPDYFLGKPKIDQYIYKVVKDATVVAAQLKTGEIDFAGFEPALLEEMQKVEHLVVKKYDTFTFTFYSYQLDKSKTDLFQDKAVRQALLYALDRKAMVDSIEFGQGAVADSIFPLISWARDPNGNPQYNFDPDKAKKLLDEAGWKPGSDGIREKNGKKLAFTIYTNAGNKVREAFVTAMQQQWKDIGVQATPKTEEWNAFLNRITKSKDFDIFLVGFAWGPDPDESTMWTTQGQNGGFNMNKYSNETVDKLLIDAVKEVDQDKRKALYHQVDQLVLEDLPSPILVFDKALVGVNKRVQNLDPNAFNTRYNVQTWAVTDGK